MHANFLSFLFHLGAVETLQEFGKADHMNQFMRNNVQRKREKLNNGVPLDRSSNDVVLKADLEEITGFAAAQPFMGMPQVAVDLCKSSIGDLLFMEISQRLNVISIPLPLGRRDLVVLTEKFFRKVDGLPQNGNFIRFKWGSFCLFCYPDHIEYLLNESIKISP